MRSLGEEGTTKLENIAELKSNIQNYINSKTEDEEPSLSEFLEEISLFTDADRMDTTTDAVNLMTVHSAKGLEFHTVFIVGMEEGLFPSKRSMDTVEDLEEERRLAYVAITPAGSSYTLYVGLLIYCSVPLVDAQRRVYRTASHCRFRRSETP